MHRRIGASRESVSNYTVARATEGDVSNVLEVRGYSADGDGGGGSFYWDPSVVLADDNNGTVLAHASGSGGWRRLGTSVTPEMFGAAGDGVRDDHLEVQAALDTSLTVVLTPGKVYNCDNYLNAIYLPIGCRLIGYGSELMNCKIYIPPGWGDVKVWGLRMRDYTGNNAAHFFDIHGGPFTFIDLDMEKTPQTGGKFGYLRGLSSGGTFVGLISRGGNGMDVSGTNHSFSDFRIFGKFDDAFAFAADNNLSGGDCRGVTMVNGYIENCSAAFSFGTGIGEFSSLPSVGGRSLRGVTISNVVAKNCTNLVYFKVGQIYDIRNGGLSEVSIVNCALLDPDGTAMQDGIVISGSNGAALRKIKISNVAIRGRCKALSAGRSGVNIFCAPNPANPGGDPAEIDGVQIDGITIEDEYGGAAHGTPGTSGHPIDRGIVLENITTGFGTIRNVSISRAVVDSVQRLGLYVGDDIDDCVEVTNSRFLNIQSTHGMFSYSDGVKWRNNVVEMASGVPIDGSTNVSFAGKSVTLNLGTTTAGEERAVCWVAPSNCYVWKIEVLNGATIVQNAFNYIDFQVRKLGAATAFEGVTTAPGGFNVIADTITRMDVNNYTSSDVYFAAGEVLRFNKYIAGAGQPTTDLSVIVHYLEY